VCQRVGAAGSMDFPSTLSMMLLSSS
jgi:hypothetical protein